MLAEVEWNAQKVLDPWSFESQNSEIQTQFQDEILRIILSNGRVRGLGSKLAQMCVEF